MTFNEIKAIQRPNKETKIYAYADDMMVSRLIQDLQDSINLVQWTEENSLKINAGKTKMIFRKGGKLGDRINYD
jgi:hypothetical protein